MSDICIQKNHMSINILSKSYYRAGTNPSLSKLGLKFSQQCYVMAYLEPFDHCLTLLCVDLMVNAYVQIIMECIIMMSHPFFAWITIVVIFFFFFCSIDCLWPTETCLQDQLKDVDPIMITIFFYKMITIFLVN